MLLMYFSEGRYDGDSDWGSELRVQPSEWNHST
jgi:hypothetical protein